MSRPFNWTGAEPQLFGGGVVMDGGVSAIFLIGQHLAWFAQRAAQRQGCAKAHWGSSGRGRLKVHCYLIREATTIPAGWR